MVQFLEDSDARTRKRDTHSFSSGGRSSSEVSQIKGISSFIRFFGLDTTIVENEQQATSLCRQLKFWGTRKISRTLQDASSFMCQNIPTPDYHLPFEALRSALHKCFAPGSLTSGY